MQQTNSFDLLHYKNTWLTIGVFDGLHLGHQALVRSMVQAAHATGAPAVVLTFDPHPAVLLGGWADFKWLTPPQERLSLLAGLGVDAVITQPFDSAFASQAAEDFIPRLHHSLGLDSLFIGYDFALGRDRQGDLARLTKLGKELGFRVVQVEPMRLEGTIISSTAIRTLIQQGAMEDASRLLGRHYAIPGTVIHGDGRGRTLQYPTANLQYPTDQLIPPNGIYATWAWLNGKRYASATNVGTNPTFTPQKTTANVETHLLDFTGDLYAQHLRLEFVQRLRDEMKFDTVQALVSQIDADVTRIRTILFPPGA